MSSTNNIQSKDFIRRIISLETSGVVRNRQEIVEALGWSKSYMSQVMSGTKQVPPHIFKRFNEVYPNVEIKESEVYSTQRLIRLEAMSSVILGALGEILAHQRGQPVTKVNDDLVSTVNSQVKQMLQK